MNTKENITVCKKHDATKDNPEKQIPLSNKTSPKQKAKTARKHNNFARRVHVVCVCVCVMLAYARVVYTSHTYIHTYTLVLS